MARDIGTEIQRVRDDLLFWERYESAVRCDLSSAAIRAGGAWCFVDPIWPGDLNAAALAAHPAAAVVATSGNHARDCARLAAALGAPFYSSADAARETGATLTLSPGAVVLPGITVLEMAGGGPGEIALWIPESSTLCFGDALVHLPATGLAILPDKYCSSPKLLRQNLAAAADLGAVAFTFAHGPPLLADASARLRKLLGPR